MPLSCFWLPASPDRKQKWSGSKVDFVVHGPRGIWAIEVKHASEVRRRDLRSLLAFIEDYPEAKARLVYRGSEKLQIDGTLCVPCA